MCRNELYLMLKEELTRIQRDLGKIPLSYCFGRLIFFYNRSNSNDAAE